MYDFDEVPDIRGSKLTSTEVTHLLASSAWGLVENGAHFVKDGEGYIRFNLIRFDNILY